MDTDHRPLEGLDEGMTDGAEADFTEDHLKEMIDIVCDAKLVEVKSVAKQCKAQDLGITKVANGRKSEILSDIVRCRPGSVTSAWGLLKHLTTEVGLC